MKLRGIPFVPNPDRIPRVLRTIPKVETFVPDTSPSAGTVHGPAESVEDLESYTELTLLSSDFPYLAVRFRSREIEVKGDHFYCHEVTGSDALYIRLGPESNPFIRLQPGSSFSRKFRSVTFGCVVTDGQAISKAVCYVSTGRLSISSPFRGYGLQNPAFHIQTVDTVWRRIGFPLATLHRTLGKLSGSVLLVNESLANTVRVGFRPSGTAVTAIGIPVLPGQSLSLPLDAPMDRGEGMFPATGLVVGVVAGTALLSILLSTTEIDLFEPEQAGQIGLVTT